MALERSNREKVQHSFWNTLPGIITAVAGLISAIGGVYAIVVNNKDTAPKEGINNVKSINPNQPEGAKPEEPKSEDSKPDKKPTFRRGKDGRIIEDIPVRPSRQKKIKDHRKKIN